MVYGPWTLNPFQDHFAVAENQRPQYRGFQNKVDTHKKEVQFMDTAIIINPSKASSVLTWPPKVCETIAQTLLNKPKAMMLPTVKVQVETMFCYIIRYYTILYYTILYYTILYYTILYYTILYYTILYYTILYYTILYYTILYYTSP